MRVANWKFEPKWIDIDKRIKNIIFKIWWKIKLANPEKVQEQIFSHDWNDH